jgi:hypothetical protein
MPSSFRASSLFRISDSEFSDFEFSDLTYRWGVKVNTATSGRTW